MSIIVKRTVVCDLCDEQLDGTPGQSAEQVISGSGWVRRGDRHVCWDCRREHRG